MSAPASERTIRPAQCTSRRWLRRLIVFGVIALAAYLVHIPFFQTLARILVVNTSSQSADTVLIFNRDVTITEAARLLDSGAVTNALVVDMNPTRLERMSIVPRGSVSIRSGLTARGIAADRITVLQGAGMGDWDIAYSLRPWLKENPSARLIVPCEAFQSRRLRYIFTRCLGDETMARIDVRAVARAEFHSANWWRSRVGWVAFTESFLGLMHVWWVGEFNGEWQEWDPDQYEKTLR